MKNMRSELPATSDSATASQEVPDTTGQAPRADGAAAKGAQAAGDPPGGVTVPAREAIGNWPDPM
ncbi:hypothetical protein SRABI83_02039 [Arthrobacter sp. Bi83]|jgi:hypothetical protein|uniref:hypothetical protein n=1 Tax=Arthrobacter sp. Bi83 TaxID=2822353 RepID=UPI001DFA76EF|nr:hypothetical protein [Arthrobacter sp. Bi83]CAH0206735.1 hypothetical protein SRABI83_02039 [Arthrobacter sp. Bi83]